MKLTAAAGLIAQFLLLTSDPVYGAGIGPQRVISNNRFSPSYGSSVSSSHGSGRLFPLLTHLRDGVIEFFFGRHPTKAAAGQSSVFRQLRAQYAGERVLRFNVSTTDEEAALAEAAARLFLDVWAFTEDYVDIRLHTNEIAPLLGLLPKSLQASQSTLISDLATAVYESRPGNNDPEYTDLERDRWALSTQLGVGDNIFFQDYQPLPVVVRWMRLLEAMFPSYVEYTVIGTSFEGRDIPALRVGMSTLANPSNPRKTLVVTGGLHAREWISTTTVNYLAWSFITSFGKELLITKLLDEVDIVFIPIVNPDGYEYTWQVDRLWRKSRQETNMHFCRGMDLDHTFGFGWDGRGAENDPCSEAYGGDAPFQAVEAMELARWAKSEAENNNVQFVGLLDLHSYSQQVLFPYSFSCTEDPPNLENLQELAAGIAKAIRISNGESYSVTSACEGAVSAEEYMHDIVRPRIESAGGSAIDWFYHEMGARYSYQIKLRDMGSYGFLLPKEHIVPTGEEMFNAMKYLGDYLLGNNGIEQVVAFEEEDTIDNFEFGTSRDVEESTFQELRRRRFRR